MEKCGQGVHHPSRALALTLSRIPHFHTLREVRTFSACGLEKRREQAVNRPFQIRLKRLENNTASAQKYCKLDFLVMVLSHENDEYSTVKFVSCAEAQRTQRENFLEDIKGPHDKEI